MWLITKFISGRSTFERRQDSLGCKDVMDRCDWTTTAVGPTSLPCVKRSQHLYILLDTMREIFVQYAKAIDLIYPV